jgi:hypothetical protein
VTGTQDYDGAGVIDSAGDHVGTVERTYVDETNVPRFVEVKIGTLLPKHRLVPADGAEMTDNGLQVPFLKDVIEEAPDAPNGDTLEGADLDGIRSYYEHDGNLEAERADEEIDSSPPGPVVTATDTADAEASTPSVPAVVSDETGGALEVGDEVGPRRVATIRDLGDVVEIPIVEEVLVKKAVVKEVLRVRKTQLTERHTVGADLRREEVETVDDAGGAVRSVTEVDTQE